MQTQTDRHQISVCKFKSNSCKLVRRPKVAALKVFF